MLKDLEEDEEVGQKGLFRPQDSEGNDIRLKSLVKLVDSEKKGRVLGFGDDGAGNMIIRVDWQFPVDMKFMSPKEMGEKRENPLDLVVQGLNEEEDIYDEPSKSYSFDRSSLYDWFKDAAYQLADLDEAEVAQIMEREFEKDYDYKVKMNEMKDKLKMGRKDIPGLDDPKKEKLKMGKKDLDIDGPKKDKLKMGRKDIDGIDECDDETIEEMRGLGKGVKNSGDRNVKTRDDNRAFPLTDINESVNNSIKTLMEGSITKNTLKEFINEEAKRVAKNLRG